MACGADGKPPKEYFNRGKDTWVRVTHEEAGALVAAALVNIAATYSGAKGAALLKAQGYDDAMIEATKGAGTQVLKFRGVMPLLGMTRVFGMYRLANAMALVDSKIRGVGPDAALGARGFDNYSWHTDLPPGHPMVTGQQTVEFDLHALEHARTAVIWGMNFITTKMPDAHWLTEARLRAAAGLDRPGARGVRGPRVHPFRRHAVADAGRRQLVGESGSCASYRATRRGNGGRRQTHRVGL